ncbi:hypothetical protein BC938DRAFT_477190 [Jimgerdemannia flammicorona]|uniref:Uncharacterized protein n=1 Tax=Jimgerdemannia flammicorona TaxID=994334 RepID=A0A433QPN4_9FUNG|nr:hypothetical protein BC938DRAFT_477190 [Jimgerdemannia flammicorona]
MGPKKKTENTKVTAAKEKKAAVEAEASKKKAIEKEVKESAEWSVGAKGPGKKEAEAAKKAELAAKKAEAARLLAEEERNIAKSKPLIRPVKGDEKKAVKKAQAVDEISEAKRSIPEFTATNIDDALDLLTLATTDDGSPSLGKGGKQIERHPERRFKAALAAEMEIMKKEHPGMYCLTRAVISMDIANLRSLHRFTGLRRTQLKDLIYKNFQVVLEYNAEKQDEAKLIDARRKEIENRLKS